MHYKYQRHRQRGVHTTKDGDKKQTQQKTKTKNEQIKTKYNIPPPQTKRPKKTAKHKKKKTNKQKKCETKTTQETKEKSITDPTTNSWINPSVCERSAVIVSYQTFAFLVI